MKKIIKISIILLGLFGAISASAATLNISPTTKTVNVGETFSINITLDTANAMVEGVDVSNLNFNSFLLEVVDSDPGTSGIQITPGTLMPSSVYNSANNSTGVITFSQVVAGGTSYSGSGVLATINFRAKAAGTAALTFDFTSGATNDSNVASNGVDVLSSVTNGTVTVGAASTPPPTPSPSGGGGGGSSGSSSGRPSYTPAPVSFQTISNNIALGSRGTDVLTLQNFLIAQGYLTADNNTGYFGYVTEAAVQQFQRTQEIVSSGNPNSTGYGAVGPMTRTRINLLIAGGLTSGFSVGSVTPAVPVGQTLSSIARNLSRGSRGIDVTNLQQFLIAQGHMSATDSLGESNITGYFGPITESAVKAFQAEQGIVSSGNPNSTGYGAVGPMTRTRINLLIAGGLTSGSTSSNAPSLQVQLDALRKQAEELLLQLQNLQ